MNKNDKIKLYKQCQIKTVIMFADEEMTVAAVLLLH